MNTKKTPIFKKEAINIFKSLPMKNMKIFIIINKIIANFRNCMHVNFLSIFINTSLNYL